MFSCFSTKLYVVDTQNPVSMQFSTLLEFRESAVSPAYRTTHLVKLTLCRGTVVLWFGLWYVIAAFLPYTPCFSFHSVTFFDILTNTTKIKGKCKGKVFICIFSYYYFPSIWLYDICLLYVFILNVQVKFFSVMLGHFSVFLGWSSTKQRINLWPIDAKSTTLPLSHCAPRYVHY